MKNEAETSKKILVVEDEERFCELIKMMLEQAGFLVETHEDGTSALESFEKNLDFNLVLTDHNMPKMTGFELAVAIREIRENAKIILMSGYPEAARKKAEELEINIDNLFDAILQKPFDLAILRGTIENTLKSNGESSGKC